MSGDIFVVTAGGRRSGLPTSLGGDQGTLFHLLQRPVKHPCPQRGVVQPRMLMGPRLRKTENRDCNFTSLYLPHSRRHGSSILHAHRKMFSVDEFVVFGKKISKFWSFICFILCVYNASPYLVVHSISRSSRATTDDDIGNKDENPNKNKYLLHDSNCSKPSLLFFYKMCSIRNLTV